MIKMTVFDFDGTLVDTLTDLALSVNRGLEAAGLPTHEINEYRYFVGNGREKLIERAMGAASSDAALFKVVGDAFNADYELHCGDHTRPYDGVPELLEKLSGLGIMTAVHSNKPHEFVGVIARKFFPDHSFTDAWGKKPEFLPKPDAGALLELLRLHGVEPEEAVYIGDSDVDVMTAKNAGLRMIGVSWGFRGREELEAAGAPYVVDTADELLQRIMQL